MKDKKIIIDDVLVQDCCYFDYENDGYEDSCYIYQNECSAQNCYYKQFKRKEQECEELKKQACGLRPELKYIIDKTCSKYNINAKYYHEKIVEIINNLDKYKQTLTEIKEIAEEQIPYLNIGEAKTMIEVEYDYAGKIYNLEQRMYKILQKISEV